MSYKSFGMATFWIVAVALVLGACFATGPQMTAEERTKAGSLLEESEKKDAADGYRREHNWSGRCKYANCSLSGKFKLCAVIRFFGKNDTTYESNCAKSMARLRQIPGAMDPLSHYFCINHGMDIVSVSASDRSRIESLADDRRICMWIDNPGGKRVAEQFNVYEITKWAEGCPQPSGFYEH